MDFLYGFLTWFKSFFGHMLDGFLMIFKGLVFGIGQIFDFTYYFRIWAEESVNFGVLDWILSVLAFILTFAVWAGVIFLIVLGIRKFIRFRKSLVGNEDLLEEISDLHRDVLRLTEEKERIMQLKVTQAGLSYEQLKRMFEDEFKQVEEAMDGVESALPEEGRRFVRLSAVDDKYAYVEAPDYVTRMTLQEICDDLRNFACVNNGLYYDIRTIRLMMAGLASTKLIILQGISGTGKTSLPYVMGKYFQNDATIASVQPSWRDRNELFGYFNEFTKKFNETEVLRRIYESGYNDDVNVIILDEMNIARVEYYFAEMLSVLEMPNPKEWRIELVPSTWENDPVHLDGGCLQIPQNVWYIGTINNDDSTFSVSDKVYDRAITLEFLRKNNAFDVKEDIGKVNITASELRKLFDNAKSDTNSVLNAADEEKLDRLSDFIYEKFDITIGNRILNQIKEIVPVFIAAGGTKEDALDFMLCKKLFSKIEGRFEDFVKPALEETLNLLAELYGKGNLPRSEKGINKIIKTL